MTLVPLLRGHVVKFLVSDILQALCQPTLDVTHSLGRWRVPNGDADSRERSRRTFCRFSRSCVSLQRNPNFRKSPQNTCKHSVPGLGGTAFCPGTAIPPSLPEGARRFWHPHCQMPLGLAWVSGFWLQGFFFPPESLEVLPNLTQLICWLFVHGVELTMNRANQIRNVNGGQVPGYMLHEPGFR